MAQKAVLQFLCHWHGRQEAGKEWPLRFLNPERSPTAGNEQDSAGRGLGPGGEGGSHGKSVHGDGSRNGEAIGDDEGNNIDGGEEDDASGGLPGENVMRTGTGADGQQGRGEIIEVLSIPAEVDTMYRTLFLKSLSTEAGYQMLIGLLDTADVSQLNLFPMDLILTDPAAQ